MSHRCVITIGVYDAVHLGHRAILSTARHLAQQTSSRLLVLAFDPHPSVVLRPGTQPPRLTTPQEKVHWLRQAGADEVELITPSMELFGQSPEQFVERIVNQYNPQAFVEGYNFRFGHQRRGDVQTLRHLGKEHGFEVVVQPQTQVSLNDQLMMPVSSTLIRWLVGCGRVADAARCLGRHYALSGPVVTGEQRGRQLQVPTANLDLTVSPDKLVPADGVYAAIAELEDGSRYAAAVSIGEKPTFGKKQLTVEAHLLDFAGDLYGRRLTLHFAVWLRDQQAFPNLQALKDQLARDIARTRQWHELGLLEEVRPALVG